MQRFAIKHNGTGNYLKDKWSGTSWWKGEEETGTPKLFKTLGSAKAWRTNWLKGPLIKEWVKSSFESFGEDECHLTHKFDPNRRACDIKIVLVTLIFEE